MLSRWVSQRSIHSRFCRASDVSQNGPTLKTHTSTFKILHNLLTIYWAFLLNITWGSANYLEGSCFQGFFPKHVEHFWFFALPVIHGPPFCSVRITVSWLRACLPVVASDCCLAATWGGNNLFGKECHNLGLNVGLVLFLKVGLNM